MNIGENIKMCREFKSLSRNDLSSKLGVNTSTISRYESGARKPSLNAINEIADVLEVEIDTLLNGINIAVYDRFDVFEIYHKLNTKTKLSKFLGFKDDYDMFFVGFSEGLHNDKNLYMKLASYLKLSQCELYNWILSNVIYEMVGWDDFNISNLSRDKLIYIIDNSILEPQSIDSLLRDGLSSVNVNNLKKFFSNQTTLKLDELKSKYSNNKIINAAVEGKELTSSSSNSDSDNIIENNKDKDIYIIQRAKNKMPKEKQNEMMKILRSVFDDYFNDED
ncbi:MAG: helix-turn-helix transcriptional regulator [Terrisporobacter sp.]|uniref:helix-turn-helix domain-containing protein n=1 Tax=Terrisporobacter sp. TaxID=1965305 RepID=UPI002FCBB435